MVKEPLRTGQHTVVIDRDSNIAVPVSDKVSIDGCRTRNNTIGCRINAKRLRISSSTLGCHRQLPVLHKAVAVDQVV